MGENDSPENSITIKLNRMKSAFSSHNVVRMREALRYLSGPKLKLFIKIPLLVHVNLPEFPGFVPEAPQARGIYNFEESGFCKEVLAQGEITQDQLTACSRESAVLGLYHIGSLGTFTQSAQSDFDYWVIIDKTRFTEHKYYNLEKKLNQIVKFSREEFDQEVTFFIMDQADIRRDCYAGFSTQETMIAPKLFLKEEFYRTFLMIAGKIPIWTILPANLKKGAYTQLVKSLIRQEVLGPLFKDFMDMGKVDPPEHRDILQGILWHICKSKEDPVKALIKATMILSHSPGAKARPILLCDGIKQDFANAGIDDYRVDPYKILFDRVIEYHETHAPGGLNLIKNAIFFRLCEYPMVRVPEPGFPKRQLLDRYIRTWNLTPFQIKKLTSYQEWPEAEKRLLDKTFVKRLSQMFKEVNQGTGQTDSDLDATQKRNFKILIHKVQERLNSATNKIPNSSTYLSRKPFALFLFQKKRIKGWILSACAPGEAEEIELHETRTCLGLLGWMVENRLFHREKASIKLDVKDCLFESREEAVSVETLYLALQPVKPSDKIFEHLAQWTKLMVLLKCPDASAGVVAMEILAVNSWGEMFEDQLRLDTTRDLDDRYKDIAKKINQYKGKTIRLLFYQLSARRNPDAVYGIKQHLKERFLAHRPGAPPRKRPLLDKL